MEGFELKKYRFTNAKRNSYKIRINNLLSLIRGSNKVRKSDNVIVHALLELAGDVRDYGAFTIISEMINGEEKLSLQYDKKVVLSIYKKGSSINIGYLRDNDHIWVEELFRLAEAHYELMAN